MPENTVTTSVVRRWQINPNVYLKAIAVTGSMERQLELRNVMTKESFSMTGQSANEIIQALQSAVDWNGKAED